VSYNLALSSRTEVGANVGYQWIDPSHGASERGVRYGANLAHRFSEHTTSSLTLSRSWNYAPATTRTDFSQLTRNQEIAGNLSLRLSRYIKASITSNFTAADTDNSFNVKDAKDYWQAYGQASLSGRSAEEGFWGLRYRLARRQTDGTDEDYFLQIGKLFYRHRLWKWLSMRFAYSHERRDHDPGSDEVDYHENRINFAIGASW
jgi:hypothetical protein